VVVCALGVHRYLRRSGCVSSALRAQLVSQERGKICVWADGTMV